MLRSDLENYRALVREIAQLKEQLTDLETALYSPKVQQYTRTPVQSGRVCDMSDAVARRIELEEMYHERLAARLAQQLTIERALDTLEDPAERMVMRYRYIDGRSWGFIIAELAALGHSERQVYRLHGFALLKLKEV